MLSTLTSQPLALQGFGVAVNANLYAALQDQNIADSLLPGSCVGDASAACQPSIRSADYTSLVTQSGIVNTAAKLLPSVPAAVGQVLAVARGSDLSGIQAASNIFFAGNPCGRDHDSRGKLIKGVPGGMLDIRSGNGAYTGVPAVDGDSTADLLIQSHATSGSVKTALNASSGYAIGVLGLATIPAGSDTWKFVKLDGISPNFNADGSVDAKQRNAFISGNYPFAMNYTAITPG